MCESVLWWAFLWAVLKEGCSMRSFLWMECVCVRVGGRHHVCPWFTVKGRPTVSPCLYICQLFHPQNLSTNFMFSQTVKSYVFPQAIIQALFYLHSSFMNLHGMLLNCRATCWVPCSSAEWLAVANVNVNLLCFGWAAKWGLVGHLDYAVFISPVLLLWTSSLFCNFTLGTKIRKAQPQNCVEVQWPKKYVTLCWMSLNVWLSLN